MATQVQFRGGTTAQNDAFTGASKELTVDTDKDVVVVHDGSTAGGHPLMAEDGSNSELALGSAGTPALKFTDTNTGIYSPGADQIALSTGGTGRLFIDDSGRCGIGTSSPTVLLDLESTSPTIRLTDSDASGTPECQISGGGGDLVLEADRDNEKSGSLIRFLVDGSDAMRINSSGNVAIGSTSADAKLHVAYASGNPQIIIERTTSSTAKYGLHAFSNTFTIRDEAQSQERLRLDSSGRLLVGTSSSLNTAYKLQIAGETDAAANVACFRGNATGQALLALTKSRTGTIGNHTIVQNNDNIGGIQFRASDGTNYITGASIETEVDGTPGTNDMPSRLVFSTTADSASSPTERLRITSDGKIGIGDDSPDALLVIKGNSDAATTPSIRLKDGTDTREAWITNASGDLSLNVGGDDNNPHGTLKIFDSGILDFAQAAGSRLRVDTSGRLLVGTTSSNDIFQESQLQIEGNTSAKASLSIHQNQSAVDGPQLILGKSRGSGSVGSSDILGDIVFAGNDGTDVNSRGAIIRAKIDGTPGTDDLPTHLAFMTTADGGSSPTERMKIKNDGTINFANVQTFADDTAAGNGGLVSGDVYKTLAGDLKIKA